MSDVGQWLHTLELGDHAAEFSAASVDGLTLHQLTEKDCAELGVTPRLRALKLLARRDALVAQLAEAAAGGAVRIIQPGDAASAGATFAALPSPEVAHAKAEAAEAKLQAETLRSELETVRSLQMRLLEELEALRSGSSPAKAAAKPEAEVPQEKQADGEDGGDAMVVNMEEEEAMAARLTAAAKAVEEVEAAATQKADGESAVAESAVEAEPAAVVSEASPGEKKAEEMGTSTSEADSAVEGGAVTEKEQEALMDVSLLPDVAVPADPTVEAVQPPPPKEDAAPVAAHTESPPPASPPQDEVTAAVQQHAAANNSSPVASDAQHLRALAAASGAQPGSPAALRSLAAAAVALDEAREETGGGSTPSATSTAAAVAAHAAAAAAAASSSPLAARARELTTAAEAALAKALQNPSRVKDVAALQAALASARVSSGAPGGTSVAATASLAMLLSDTTGGLGTVPELLPASSPVPTAAAKFVPPPLPLDGSLRIVSGAGDGSVRVTRVIDTVKERSLDGHRDAVRCVCILPGAPPRLVSGSVDRTLRVWRWADGACEAVLKGHVDTVRAVAPMGPTSCVSASDDKTLRIWEGLGGSTGGKAAAPVCAHVLQGHTAAVWAVCVISGPPVRVVSGSWDHTLRVWEPATGTCVRTLAGHSDTVNALCTLPGNRIASGGGDRCIRVWAPLNGEDGDKDEAAGGGSPGAATPLCERVCWGHTSTVYALAALPDGRIVSGSGDGTLRLWGATGTSCERVMKSGSGSVSGTVCALDTLGVGRVVSGSTDRMVSIWNLVDGTCERILGGHASSVWAVASMKL